MKHKRHSHDETPAVAAADSDGSRTGVEFAPFSEEVARRAYFSYVNEGAPQGRHVQHWLDAEAQLLKERTLTRTHGFHHQT